MKKILEKISVIMLLFCLFILTGKSVKAVDNQNSYLDIEISQNKSNNYILQIKNISSEVISNINGTTEIPDALRNDFKENSINWNIKKLIAGEVQTIQLNKSGAALPNLGANSNLILSGLGAILLLLTIVYLLYKKRFSILMLFVLFLGCTLQTKQVLAKEQKIENNFQSVLKNENGESYTFNTKVTFEVDTDKEDNGNTDDNNGLAPGGGQGNGQEKDFITISGVALDKDGAILKEKDLVIKSQDSNQTVSTDMDGNFFTQIEKAKNYQIIYEQSLASTINVKSIKNYKIDNQIGEIVLGKRFPIGDTNSFAKLNISTIYFDYNPEISYHDNSLILPTVEDIGVGDIVVIGPKDEYDNGFSLKVNSVKVEDNQTTLNGTTPLLLEVFQEIHIDNNDLDYSNAKVELEEGVELLEYENVDDRQRISGNMETEKSITINVKMFLQSLFPNNKLIQDINRMEFSKKTKFSVNVDVSTFYKKENQFIDVRTIDEQKLEVAMENKITKENENEIGFYPEIQHDGNSIKINENLGSVYVFTGVPILGIKFDLNLKVEMGIDGKYEITTSYGEKQEYGYHLENGEYSEIDEKKDPDMNIDGKISGKVYIESGVCPSAKFSVVGISLLGTDVTVAGRYNLYGDLGLSLNQGFNYDLYSSISAVGEIKIYSPIIDTTFEKLSNVKDNVFSYKRGIEVYLQKTEDMKFKDYNNGTILKNNRLYVMPGQKVYLMGLAKNGILLSEQSHLYFNPTLSLIGGIGKSVIKDYEISNDLLSLNIDEEAKIGDKKSVLLIYANDPIGLIIYNKAVLEIIVGNAQDTVDLSGTIKDKDTDKPLENAAVSFYDSENELIEEVKTNKQGVYNVALITGNYKVCVKAKGYEEENQKIDVSKNNKKLDIKLSKEKETSRDLDEDAILNGDYSSMNGTWKNTNDEIIIFKDGYVNFNRFTLPPMGESSFYLLFKPEGEESKWEDNIIPISWDIPSMPSFYITLVLKGDKVTSDLLDNYYGGDKTDFNRDRFLISGGGYQLMFAGGENGGLAEYAFYREN